MLKNGLILPLLLLFLYSCEKAELPIEARDPGSTNTVQVEMGPDYRYQLFYDLGSLSIVAENLKTDWDLGFESSSEGWHIILNSSRGGAAATDSSGEFGAVTTVEEADWRWDASSGHLDSTAIGDYRNSEQVFIIDRGFDPAGAHTGYRKLKILQVSDSGYLIRCATLEGKGDTTLFVAKDPDRHFTTFSFQDNKVVPIEPPQSSWDVCFTQYTHLFDDPPPLTPYLVTGLLINSSEVEVAVDSLHDFDEINLEDIPNLNFSNRRDIIGYDWKVFDFDLGTYTVFSSINYIVKDTEGRYFKMHFSDFYTNTGEKGAPKFEIQEL